MSPLVFLAYGAALSTACARALPAGDVAAPDAWRADASDEQHRNATFERYLEALLLLRDRGGGAAAAAAWGATGDLAVPPEFCSSLGSYVEEALCRSQRNASAGLEDDSDKPSRKEVWGYGLGFVTLINLSSMLGVVFLPLMNKRFFQTLLTMMVGLAVGSLSASSVFHLVPQAFHLTEDPLHSYLDICLMMWAGIWVFFLAERLMRIASNAKKSNLQKVPTKEASDASTPTDDLSDGEDCAFGGRRARGAAAEVAPTTRHGHSHGRFQKGKEGGIASVAWMVIFGDGLHNFIDGLSIGAAFNESVLTGLSISVAVLCEELPHELGDFAVLLSAGMSMRQALLYNFLSACTCYLGLFLGILLGAFDAEVYVFAFAAGMFMYISLVDMMAEMNSAADEALQRGPLHALKMLLLQNIGMLSGGALLFSLARFQDQIILW